MARLLGLDIGKKKVGIAVSDQTCTLARALKTVSLKALKFELQNLLKEFEDLQGLVLGLPKSKSGDAEKEMMKLGSQLSEQFNLPVYYEDERLTSWAARDLLKEAGYKPEKVKELEDQVAAQLILQSFLNGQKTKLD